MNRTKTILATLALAATAGVGLASKAQASPTAPVAKSALFHDRVRVGVGVGFGGGYAGGHWATGYHQVYRTWVVGYDAYGRPIYQSGWVTEPYQVWVPAQRVSYGPRVHLGFRFR